MEVMLSPKLVILWKFFLFFRKFEGKLLFSNTPFADKIPIDIFYETKTKQLNELQLIQMIEVKTILTKPKATTESYIKPSPNPYCGHYINKHTKQTHQIRKSIPKPSSSLNRDVKNEKNSSRKRKFSELIATDERAMVPIANATFQYDLLYIPRILKNDLRRQYPIMFMNVFNSGDYQFMKKWMETFSNGNIAFLLEAPARPLPLRAETRGIEDCSQAFFLRMIDAPDQVFSLDSVQIRVRSDGTAITQSQYSLSGTKIIHVDPTKIPRILAYSASQCGKANGHLLSLPTLPTPPLLIQLVKQCFALAQRNQQDYTTVIQSLLSAVPVSNHKDMVAYMQSIINQMTTFQKISSNNGNSTSSPNSSDPEIIVVEEDDQWFLQMMTDFLEGKTDDISFSNHSHSPASEILTITTSEQSAETNNTFHVQASELRQYPVDIPLFLISEAENAYLFEKFDRCLEQIIHPEISLTPTAEETLPLGFPFNYCGNFSLHLDRESKVTLNHITSFLKLPPTASSLTTVI